MLLIIDNYDSFTYNLVQQIGALDAQRDIRVVRNDAATVDALLALAPQHVVISPGPCTPRESGVSVELIRRLAGRVPILGVCLGHQCIAQAFGAAVVRAPRLMHGKTSAVHHVGIGIFEAVPSPMTAARYHSLAVPRDCLPPDFEVTAWTAEGELMGMRHRDWPLNGVQFHPESFLTEHGAKLMANFLRE